MAKKNKKSVIVEELDEEVPVQEKTNLAEWLESRLHLKLTEIADDLYGGGNVTRDERKLLSAAISVALDAYHQSLVENAPQLFERRPWDDAPEQGEIPSPLAAITPPLPPADAETESPNSESANRGSGEGDVDLREAGDGGLFVPLMERALRRDGTIPIKIIQPGWGSSGYYPAEVLERDGPQVFQRGLKMFWNHPTTQEEAERPERRLDDLAAELVSDARWRADGPAGAGLYADAKVFEAYQPHVDDLAEHIGVSIRAVGRAQRGSVEGREGQIVTALTAAKSVDFVTAPGAGGQILSLFEAARTPAVQAALAANQKPEEVPMEEEKLKEANAKLQKELDEAKATNARQGDALILREASDLTRDALGKANLPEATRARLMESLPKAAPVKDGVLDKEAYLTQIAEAVKAEVKYLTEVAGLGKITGLGESDAGDAADEANVEEALVQAFRGIGLSESAAKIAAQGR
jgi:hypothetical protein